MKAKETLRRAQEYDKKAKKVWSDQWGANTGTAALSCRRREAIELLKAGRAIEAVEALKSAPPTYREFLHHSGINHSELHHLQPVMAAVKALADAMEQTGSTDILLRPGKFGRTWRRRRLFWKHFGKGSWKRPGGNSESNGPRQQRHHGATMKKSKAAMRKQQKRKAQQQKKAGVAATEATVGGEDVGQEQGEKKEQVHEQIGERHEQKEQEGQQAVAVAAAAMGGLALGAIMDQDQEEEE